MHGADHALDFATIKQLNGERETAQLRKQWGERGENPRSTKTPTNPCDNDFSNWASRSDGSVSMIRTNPGSFFFKDKDVPSCVLSEYFPRG
jgi:hypothetical protein